MSCVAYVADGGLVGLMPLEPATGETRHRKSHAALSAMAVADDQLWLLTAREIPANGGLYVNGEWWRDDTGQGIYPKRCQPPLARFTPARADSGTVLVGLCTAWRQLCCVDFGMCPLGAP
jgi:hypothetical protein